MSDPSKPEEEPASLALTEAAETGLSSLGAPSRVISLASGRQIEIGGEGGEEWIAVRAPSGQHLVTMRLGDDGPIFSFSRGSLEIEAALALSLSCETLSVQASGSASIAVGGDLRERVGGAVVRSSGGPLSSVARSVAIEASPGGITVNARQDVSLDGERIRLNSEDPPMPLTWEEHRGRQARGLGEGAPAALEEPEKEP